MLVKESVSNKILELWVRILLLDLLLSSHHNPGLDPTETNSGISSTVTNTNKNSIQQLYMIASPQRDHPTT